MDEKLKNNEKKVMLVLEGGNGQLKAVSKMNKKGEIKTVDPTESNLASLLNVNTHDSALEAFFKKMHNISNTLVYFYSSSYINSIDVKTILK